MRQFRFMLMLLGAAGIAVSCEKDVIDDPIFDKASTVDVTENERESKAALDEQDEAQQFVGFWKLSAVAEDNKLKDYEWRFYNDGTTKLIIDSKNPITNDSSFEYHYMDYSVKDGKLYIESQAGGSAMRYEMLCKDGLTIWDYTFDGDKLIVQSNMVAQKSPYEFIKSEDANDLLVGSWSGIYQTESGEWERLTFVFETPTYGRTYHNLYKDISEEPYESGSLYTYRYSIENGVLNIKTHTNNIKIKYYRVAGNTLYLSDKPGGEEIPFTKDVR